MAYAAIPKRLTPAIVAEAEGLLAESRHRPQTEWREPRTGLALRFNALSATFLLRTEKKTVTLGPLGATSVQTLRHLAKEARLALSDGRDPKDYIRTYRERIDAGDAPGVAHVTATNASARTAGIAYDADRPWRLSKLIERFCAHMARNVLKPGRWADQYPRYFDDAALDALRDKRVCNLSYRDLFELKRALVPAGGAATSRAARILRQTVAMLQWAHEEEPINCGLIDVEPFWPALRVDYRSEKRRRAPGARELARMIVVVERHAALGELGLNAPPALQALMRFVFVTGQRDGAAARLKRADILPHPTLEDWRIAHFHEEDVKGRRDESLAHAVPLPPSVMTMLEAMWGEVDPDGKSDCAFPNRNGDALSPAKLNALFKAMRGDRDPPRPTLPAYCGKPGPKLKPRFEPIDLFELYLRDLRPHSGSDTRFWMHDVRRSLTNFLANRQLGRAASAILAHRMTTDEGDRDEETFAQRMSNTTSRYYFTAQQIDLKTQGLALWADELDAALAEERKTFAFRGRVAAGVKGCAIVS